MASNSPSHTATFALASQPDRHASIGTAKLAAVLFMASAFGVSLRGVSLDARIDRRSDLAESPSGLSHASFRAIVSPTIFRDSSRPPSVCQATVLPGKESPGRVILCRAPPSTTQPMGNCLRREDGKNLSSLQRRPSSEGSQRPYCAGQHRAEITHKRSLECERGARMPPSFDGGRRAEHAVRPTGRHRKSMTGQSRTVPRTTLPEDDDRKAARRYSKHKAAHRSSFHRGSLDTS
jgi:hypothetical protein